MALGDGSAYPIRGYIVGYFIECHFCEAIVDANVVGQTGVHGTDEEIPDSHVTLAKCPRCQQAFLGLQEALDDTDNEREWSRTYDQPVRVWPAPPLNINWAIPEQIRNSLWEANPCLKAKAYTASVVMGGRALEGVGRYFWPATESERGPLMLSAGPSKTPR